MTKVWNIGGKVRDLEAEQAFMTAAGADVRGIEIINSDGTDRRILDTSDIYRRSFVEHHPRDRQTAEASAT